MKYVQNDLPLCSHTFKWVKQITLKKHLRSSGSRSLFHHVVCFTEQPDVKCLLFPGVQEVFCCHVSRLHPVDRSLLLPDGVVGSSGLFTCLHPM